MASQGRVKPLPGLIYVARRPRTENMMLSAIIAKIMGTIMAMKWLTPVNKLKTAMPGILLCACADGKDKRRMTGQSVDKIDSMNKENMKDIRIFPSIGTDLNRPLNRSPTRSQPRSFNNT